MDEKRHMKHAGALVRNNPDEAQRALAEKYTADELKIRNARAEAQRQARQPGSAPHYGRHSARQSNHSMSPPKHNDMPTPPKSSHSTASGDTSRTRSLDIKDVGVYSASLEREVLFMQLTEADYNVVADAVVSDRLNRTPQMREPRTIARVTGTYTVTKQVWLTWFSINSEGPRKTHKELFYLVPDDMDVQMQRGNRYTDEAALGNGPDPVSPSSPRATQVREQCPPLRFDTASRSYHNSSDQSTAQPGLGLPHQVALDELDWRMSHRSSPRGSSRSVISENTPRPPASSQSSTTSMHTARDFAAPHLEDGVRIPVEWNNVFSHITLDVYAPGERFITELEQLFLHLIGRRLDRENRSIGFIYMVDSKQPKQRWISLKESTWYRDWSITTDCIKEAVVQREPRLHAVIK